MTSERQAAEEEGGPSNGFQNPGTSKKRNRPTPHRIFGNVKTYTYKTDNTKQIKTKNREGEYTRHKNMNSIQSRQHETYKDKNREGVYARHTIMNSIQRRASLTQKQGEQHKTPEKGLSS